MNNMTHEAISNEHTLSAVVHEPRNSSWGTSMEQGRKTVQASMLCPIEDEQFDNFGPGIGEGVTLTSQNCREVCILSPDPLVRGFLRGILRFQGFQSKDVSDCQDVFWNEIPSSKQVVFIDGSYLGDSESDHIRLRVQEFVQRGVYFVVLADQKWSMNFAQFFNNGAYQILWKPLDYRKIGQAMAQVWSR